ncbi:MAG: hypothetical protein M2R45_04336 [Verrucomicrobia subdivision 3 bacterium]|nr:hypothetical protein [Limisphaerales bacterium]MCS1416040.1 hypothetical protein [Limisphaerales bacterium]
MEFRGTVKVYDPAVQALKSVGMLAVNLQCNPEQGLKGMTLDPNFDENGWMSLYYYHPVEAKACWWRIPRLSFLNGPAQQGSCCHTGGGMTWDQPGNLYLTVGNNRGNNISAHTDERHGMIREVPQIRIHPEPDGSYTIPEGNMFSPGSQRPVLRFNTMGHRNAWRVTVDSATGYLYWR